MKKKLLSLVLLTMLSVSMIACGGNQSEDTEEVVQFGMNDPEIASEMEQLDQQLEEEYQSEQEQQNRELGKISLEEFETYIEEEIILTSDNMNDYIVVSMEEYEVKDDFGESTGTIENRYFLTLKEGYYTFTEDLIVEVEYCYVDYSNNDYVMLSDFTISAGESIEEMNISQTTPYKYIELYKVQGTIYKLNIPEEYWVYDENEECDVIRVIDGDNIFDIYRNSK